MSYFCDNISYCGGIKIPTLGYYPTIKESQRSRKIGQQYTNLYLTNIHIRYRHCTEILRVRSVHKETVMLEVLDNKPVIY